MSTMLEEAVRVITAVVDCPGESRTPSLSQLNVIGPFAPAGFQLLVDILNVKEVPVPVFLTYTVFVTVPPGVNEPQSILVKGVVQALSEYTPRFGVAVIEPAEDTVLLTLRAP